ncbi:MAG: RNA methyltransferase [Chloroflexaceae bacterium]|nr:RNA methyltransferase [Chloroflexaceae bacterium]
MTGTVALERIVIVLNQPQDVVNIGGVVRCMKNMGFRWLRLVSPVSFNADDITRLAHRSEDILSNTRIYSDLNTALSDAVYVVGTTARMRGQHTIRSDIRTVAVNITQQTEQGIVALLFGPEDNGLDRQALDRCHVVLRIPADPTYPSLNLAQAVLLLLYELRMSVIPSGSVSVASPTLPNAPPVNATQLETLFQAWERALHAIDFFKDRDAATVMRPIRTLVYRARLTQREAALLIAMAREVLNYVQRHQ